MNEKRFSFVSMSGFRALMCAVLVAVGLAACTIHDDNPVVNPQDVAKEIVGQWIMINDIPADADFNLEDFEIDDDFPVALLDDHKEVAYLRFSEDGEGMFIYFNVDKTNVPFGSEDDEDMQMSVLFDYTVQPDGTIKVFNMTDVDGTEDNEDLTFRYDNGSLIADDGETQFTLHRVSDDEAAQMETWLEFFGRKGAADWNINTSDMRFGVQRTLVPALTVDNWQDHEDIFIYVQNGGDQDIYDAKTGNQVFGFEHHKLPWSRGANESPNLPESIWKEVWNDGVKEGNPWRLAMMQIGENSTKNGNFLAFYNKYTGVLRFFFYVHEGITSNGSTHWWGLQLNDLLASRSVFRYGVPLDRNITSAASK